jgi:hypothetical protein
LPDLRQRRYVHSARPRLTMADDFAHMRPERSFQGLILALQRF